MKVLFATNNGTLLVSRFSVTFPLLPPPVRAVPAFTLVIVPVATEAHTHADPFHCNTWFVPHVFSRPTFSVPVVPPPVRPLPEFVSTPVIVPVPLPYTTSNSGG